MYADLRGIRAAIAFLVFWTFSCNIASPQTDKFAGHAANPLLLTNLPLAANPCAKNSGDRYVVPGSATAASWNTPFVCGTPPDAMPTVNPCNGTSPVRIGCDVPRDLVQADLDAMGRAGQKISLAREKALEILQTENGCASWFREKDSNPAATFRTLSFVLDRKGDDFVLESRDLGPSNIYRSPYVAKVFQGDGPNATVTINMKGAFFSLLARVVQVRREGGPINFRGPRILHVGPYAGDTLQAQVVTLLHEFGHVLDLLPPDENNVDGKSMRNTEEVLRFCRSEVESKARRSALSASRQRVSFRLRMTWFRMHSSGEE